jgi:hypothetical protein
VYRREAATLHAEMAADVEAAGTLEDMFRTLVRGALKADAERGPVFASLRSAGGWSRDLRRQQHERDRRTVRFFAARAVEEFNLHERQARSAMAILLFALESVLAQWRRRPTPENALQLEDTYVNVVVGALERLAASP